MATKRETTDNSLQTMDERRRILNDMINRGVNPEMALGAAQSHFDFIFEDDDPANISERRSILSQSVNRTSDGHQALTWAKAQFEFIHTGTYTPPPSPPTPGVPGPMYVGP